MAELDTITSPIARVRALYDAEDNPKRKFGADLAWHLRYGYVYSDPDTFIMARPVERARPDEFQKLGAEFLNSDCWFVWMVAGKKPLKRFIDLAPQAYEWVAWTNRRTAEVRIYRMAKVKEKTDG